MNAPSKLRFRIPAIATLSRTVLLLALLCPVCGTAQAQSVAPPPGIHLPAPEQAPLQPVAIADSATQAPVQLSTRGAPLTRADGDSVSNWLENAEGGSAKVIDGTDPSYSLIQSEVVAEGNHAFHLANPDFNDNYFELDVTIDVQADTKLFFQSRLRTATIYQVAKVQLSTDGGSSWPHTVYEQAGSDQPGEGSFALRTVDLGSSFAGQQLRIRFYFDFISTSAYIGVNTQVGWLIDDIQIGSSFLKSEWTIGNPTASEVLYLEFINRARADAQLEANRLANSTDPDILNAYNFFNVSPADIITQFNWSTSNCMDAVAQPLAFQSQLLRAAQLHTQDMFNNVFQGHISSQNPPAPFQPGDSLGSRLAAVGYGVGPGGASENVYTYASSIEHGHAGLNVDWGESSDPSSPCYSADFVDQGMQNPAGHRISIHNGSFNEAGIGVINGSNGSVGPQLLTQDFGGSAATYITGVVYQDADNNNFYSARSDTEHEGVGGVRIDVEGSVFYTLSTASGAYALPVDGDGNYTVTFSGAGIVRFSTQVQVSDGLNVKLDHQPVMSTGYTAWSDNYGLVAGPEGDDDGDGMSNVMEWLLLGMEPKIADADALPQQFTRLAEGGWRISLDLRPEASDVSRQLQFSNDLVNWQAAGVFAGTQLEVDTAEALTARTDGSHDQLFVRLRATLDE